MWSGIPARERAVADAMHRTHRWLDRCIARTELGDLDTRAGRALRHRPGRHVPGAADRERAAGCRPGRGRLRDRRVERWRAEGRDGRVPRYHDARILPDHKPRYLMGVGSPEDLWNGVAQGVDMFDCVLPTRLARNAALFTLDGRINIRNRQYRDMSRPVDEECDCHTCQNYTAAYLHHLYRARRNPRPEAGHDPQYPLSGPANGDHARRDLVRHICGRAARIPRSVSRWSAMSVTQEAV